MARRGSGGDDARAGRAALLDLLADLFLRELDLPLALTLAADPALAEALQPPDGADGVGALRAEYARLLLLEAPPYASLFLEAPPVIGGETARHWEEALTVSGIPSLPLERASSPDHAGLYLRALAYAERGGAPGPILAEALRWLPQYLTALERDDPNGFYGRVAQLAAYALGECARHATPPAEPAGAAPPEIPPPEDDRLRTLARWLCTPLWSGWYLTPGSLRALSRALGSAPGRTDRAALLEQVFEASGLDDAHRRAPRRPARHAGRMGRRRPRLGRSTGRLERLARPLARQPGADAGDADRDARGGEDGWRRGWWRGAGASGRINSRLKAARRHKTRLRGSGFAARASARASA